MIEGKYLYGNDDLSLVYDVRRQVFCDEMKISQKDLEDTLDSFGIHVIALNAQQVIAVGRLLYDGERYTIDQIAVLKECRRQKYGDFIVRMLIYRAMEAGAEKIYVDTFPEAEEFFASIGFEVTGEKFQENEIWYLPMELKVEKLHTCCHK